MRSVIINVSECTKVLCNVNNALDEVENTLREWYQNYKREDKSQESIKEEQIFRDKTSVALEDIRIMVKELILESVATSLAVSDNEL